MDGSFVVIPGLAEWRAKQGEDEDNRKRAFTRRVKVNEGRAALDRRLGKPASVAPLTCASCAKPLSSRMHGIETPAGRLKCPRCRVGVKA